MSNEIKALEEELKSVKQQLQSLSNEKKKPNKELLEETKVKASEKADSSSKKKKKKLAKEQDNKNDRKEFIQQLREDYHEEATHHLEKRSENVAYFLKSSVEQREMSWQKTQEELQNGRKLREEYMENLRVNHLQEQIERVKWLQQMKVSQRERLETFIGGFYDTCQAAREERQQQRLLRSKDIDRLLNRA